MRLAWQNGLARPVRSDAHALDCEMGQVGELPPRPAELKHQLPVLLRKNGLLKLVLVKVTTLHLCVDF